LKWEEGERIELIHGDVYAMNSTPSRVHQKTLGLLFTEFSNFLSGKRCEVYIAPFDVRLPKGQERDEDIDTVVQPDLSVICDPSKLDDRGCKGAPDLVAEVISPGSLKLDLTLKKRLYEQAGVKEFWIVYPQERIVMVYSRDEHGNFDDGETYDQHAVVPVGIFDDFQIDLSKVFA
jgi:Uma2 family endonuclease